MASDYTYGYGPPNPLDEMTKKWALQQTMAQQQQQRERSALALTPYFPTDPFLSPLIRNNDNTTELIRSLQQQQQLSHLKETMWNEKFDKLTQQIQQITPQ